MVVMESMCLPTTVQHSIVSPSLHQSISLKSESIFTSKLDTADMSSAVSIHASTNGNEYEIYRAATYRRYQQFFPVCTKELAAAGFYYTGYRDKVKCFSCGISVENWLETDDPKLKYWHSRVCEFFTGVTQKNKPLGTNPATVVETTEHHKKSSSPAKTRRTQHSTTATTKCSNNNSYGTTTTAVTVHHQNTTVQTNNSSDCLRSNNNVSTRANNTSSSTTARINNTSSSTTARINNTSSSTTARINNNYSTYNSSENNNCQQQPPQDDNSCWVQLFPCAHPAHPHMRSTTARMESFQSWQKHRVKAQPKELAESGLYYTGDRDKVKCWYCGGGLQNWEYMHDPWFEHARWYPTCEHILQKKGPEFIHNAISKCPEHQRSSSGIPRNRERQVSNEEHHHHSNDATTVPVPKVTDSRDELRHRVKKEITKSPFVTQALQMGFEKKQIKSAFERRLDASSKAFDNLEDLIDSIIGLQASTPPAPDAPSSSRGGAVTNPVTELRKLQDSKRCKVCRHDDAQVVLLPCGHHCSCNNCSVDLYRCPVCNVKITEKIRVFSS